MARDNSAGRVKLAGSVGGGDVGGLPSLSVLLTPSPPHSALARDWTRRCAREEALAGVRARVWGSVRHRPPEWAYWQGLTCAGLSSQFRDIATIVMEKTINPETRRPYTITMIERLMHEIHFAVDPNLTSKEQALKVIKKLMEHFPIKRAPPRVRFTAPKPKFAALLEKVEEWNASVISKDASGNPTSIVCEIEPSILHSCEERLKDMQGRVEVPSVSAHAEGGPSVDQHDNIEELQTVPAKESDAVAHISETMQKQSISRESQGSRQGKQQRRCTECDVLVEDKPYREHCKSRWHRHNDTRHKNWLPPLSQEGVSGRNGTVRLQEGPEELCFLMRLIDEERAGHEVAAAFFVSEDTYGQLLNDV